MAGALSEHVQRSYLPSDLEVLAGGEQGASSRAKGLLLTVLLGLERKGFLCLLHVAHVPMATAVFATVAANPSTATNDGGAAVGGIGDGSCDSAHSKKPLRKAKMAVVRDPVYGFVSPVVRASARASVRRTHIMALSFSDICCFWFF